MDNLKLNKIREAVRDVPDFPKPGILFKDITPVLQDRELFRLAIDLLVERYLTAGIERVVAIDARGFLFGGALAYVLGAGLALVRKKGKLPHLCVEESYDLEYGSNTIEMHTDSIQRGQRTLIVDDVLATGGTMAATVNLVRKLGGTIHEAVFLIELGFLKGRDKLPGLPVHAFLRY